MRLKPTRLWMPLAWLLTLAAGLLAGAASHRATREAAVAALLTDARRCAVAFRADELAALTGTREDLPRLAYQQVKDRLIRLRAVSPDVRFVYLFRHDPATGGVVFLADSEPADSSEVSLPGDSYPEAPDSPGLQEIIRTGEPAFEGPLQDSFGEWITGYALALDHGPGAAKDILGLDVAADYWSRDLYEAALRSALYVWLLGGLPLGLYQVMRARGRQGARLHELAVALDRSDSPVMILDPAERIEYVNQGLCRQLGYSREELVGRDWKTFAGRVDDAERDARIGALRAGRAWEGSWLNRRKDGSTYPVKGLASPVLNSRGALVSFIMVLDDLTRVRHHEAELEAALERAEAGDRAKGQFLATMSHEVRTPLNGIVGFASLLLDTPLTPEQREYAQTIRTSSEALIELTSQILDFSRIELGRFEPAMQPCAVRDLVEDVLEVFAGRAADKGLELLHRIEPGVPAQVLTDTGRLRQVLVNLVGNAVKFTATGEIEVDVRLTGEGKLEFAVRDTGPGIAATDLDKLFKPFSQVDASVTRRHGGAGLGLAISRSLVEALGGTIRVESESGRGSRFVFILPAPAVPAESEAPAPASPVAGRRIAICTRHDGLRAELGRLVESWQATPCPGPADPLPAADLALVDCDADTMESVNRRPINDPTWPAARVVGLVPVNLPAEARQVMRPRFATLLNKPVRHELLRDVIGGLLLPGGMTDTRTPFSELHLRVLVVEDNRVNQLLMQRMLDSLGCAWATVPNGRRALEELSVNDYDLVMMDLHMPELDGVAATRMIRAGEAGPVAREVWIAAVTADSRREQRERAFAAGVNDYLHKPVALADVEAALRRYRAERRMSPR